MPQLDKVTFASQIFWLFLSFFTLYFVTTKWLLPVISTLLKVRTKYLSKISSQVTSANEETEALEHDKNFFYRESMRNTLLYLQFVDKESISWYDRQAKSFPEKKEKKLLVSKLYQQTKLLNIINK